MTAFFARSAFSSASLPAALAQSGVPVYGRTPANLRRWQTALARMKTEGYRPKLVMIGDSKTVGAGAGTGPTSGGYTYTDGAEPSSKPARLVAALAARGVPASRNSFMASSGLPSPAAKLAYDRRLSGLSGWSGGAVTLGGVAWATAGTTPLTYAPQGSVDGADLYYLKQGGFGIATVTADADGTVLATLDGNGVDTFGKASIALPRGSHAINVQRTGGGYFGLLGIVAHDSASPSVDVINAGAFGTASAYHTQAGSGPWAAENALAILRPDLVTIQLGSNDLNMAVETSVFAANVQSLVVNAKAAGADVVLEVATFGAAGGYGTDAAREAYRQAVVALGLRAGCTVVDHSARFVSYALASDLGLMRDQIHETAAGYADVADALAAAIIL